MRVNEFAGRALLRLKDHHLELLGVEAEEQQQEILQDLLLLRVQEEIDELSDICSGENAKRLYLLQAEAETQTNTAIAVKKKVESAALKAALHSERWMFSLVLMCSSVLHA